MKVQGQIHRVTDLKAFLASYAKTGGHPTEGHGPWGRARVHLATDFPAGTFVHSLIPGMSLKTDTDSHGRFSVEAPAAMHPFRAQVLAFDIGSTPSPLPGAPALPVLSPFYRCEPFKLSEGAGVKQIYVYKAKTPTELGISQEELNQQIKDLRKAQGLDKLRATIASSKVNVRAEKDGGDLRFAAYVRGSTAADLDRVIDIKAGEIDIDLPGPDFIVGLCVDKDEIEAAIRKGLVKLSAKVSKALLADLDKQMPAIAKQASVTVWRTRHVQIGQQAIKFPGLPDVSLPVFAVVPDGAFGIPRRWD